MVPNKFRTQRRSFGDGGEHRQSVFDSADRVLFVLIGTNLVVTTLWSKADTHLRKAMMVAFFTTSIVHLEKGNYHTVFTSMFSHVDLSQLFTNMLGLYFFGRDISHILGSKRFLGLYLAGGVLSSCAALEEQMRSRRVSPNLGANGAVNAITALSILLYPHTTFRVFGILPVRSWFAGSLFIGRDFFDWIGKNRDALFASLASIGCGGLYYVSMLRNVRRLR
ncbi:hypothetical protein Poli38472_003237 [Pythium oligandrum]|uniref:Peptidase S54 rhomboid domain-containing protein n=1 Tax=Pythium oligandrum TaxID=41045 RepID=A0A8K1C784_PYTOL|nr:hypothetical protein Poli38472_003237 [Pythium oligandrum]|eukprot:TMW57312.1 hypothetical protein Poli38472_003237 [Pythium oligandrum]